MQLPKMSWVQKYFLLDSLFLAQLEPMLGEGEELWKFSADDMAIVRRGKRQLVHARPAQGKTPQEALEAFWSVIVADRATDDFFALLPLEDEIPEGLVDDKGVQLYALIVDGEDVPSFKLVCTGRAWDWEKAQVRPVANPAAVSKLGESLKKVAQADNIVKHAIDIETAPPVVPGKPPSHHSSIRGYYTGKAVATDEELRKGLLNELPAFYNPVFVAAAVILNGSKLDDLGLARKTMSVGHFVKQHLNELRESAQRSTAPINGEISGKLCNAFAPEKVKKMEEGEREYRASGGRSNYNPASRGYYRG